jgi:hypothetical protein
MVAADNGTAISLLKSNALDLDLSEVRKNSMILIHRCVREETTYVSSKRKLLDSNAGPCRSVGTEELRIS